MKRLLVGDIQFSDEEKQIILEILESGRISEYKYVARFEREWAKFIGTKHAVLVNSGTSALIAGLLALVYDERYPKIKPGAKVIVSPVTYIATVNAIKIAGMEPVFVDIHPQDFTLITEQIEELLAHSDPEEYGLILPVHLMGYPNDMDALRSIADRYDLQLFEDAAQAHGSVYKGRKTGTLSLLADYSFYIAHNIQVGEMGAVVTDDEQIATMIKKIKAGGRLCDCPICTRSKGHCPREDTNPLTDNDPRFMHDVIGYNFKTMEFQAGIGLVQLKRIDSILERRRRNVKLLNEGLKPFADFLRLPIYSEDVSYLAYPLVIKDRRVTRKAIRKHLESNGIESRPLFGSIPTQQPAYADLKPLYDGKLPNADDVGHHGFYIGAHQYITDEDIDYMVFVFNEFFKGVK